MDETRHVGRGEGGWGGQGCGTVASGAGGVRQRAVGGRWGLGDASDTAVGADFEDEVAQGDALEVRIGLEVEVGDWFRRWDWGAWRRIVDAI